MSTTLTMKNKNGEPIYIETDSSGSETQLISSKRASVAKAADTMEESLQPIIRFTNTLMEEIKKSTTQPSGIELEFGIKLNGEIGFWEVVKIAGEGSITLKLSWENK